MKNREWLNQLSDNDFAEWMYSLAFEGFDTQVNEEYCREECEHYEECMRDALSDCLNPQATATETYSWWLGQEHNDED